MAAKDTEFKVCRLKRYFQEANDHYVTVETVRDVLTTADLGVTNKELGMLVRKAFPTVKKHCSNSITYYKNICIRKELSDSTNQETQTFDNCTQTLINGDLPPALTLARELLGTKQKQIASGAFCTTYATEYNDLTVCVKHHLYHVEVDEVRKEAAIMLSIPSHQSMIFLVGVTLVRKPYLLVTSLFGGTQPIRCRLSYHARANSLSFRESVIVAIQLIDGVMHMHSSNVVHCDLKPDNILIINFGLAEYISENRIVYDALHIVKDWNFMKERKDTAPEVQLGLSPCPKTDVFGIGYSLGVVLKSKGMFYRNFDHCHQLLRKCRLLFPYQRTDLLDLLASFKEIAEIL